MGILVKVNFKAFSLYNCLRMKMQKHFEFSRANKKTEHGTMSETFHPSFSFVTFDESQLRQGEI